MSVLFSVIVPIYNVENYLCKCIDSILNQSFVDFEVILVDDGSPDQCPYICDEYAKRDSRIKVIHKKNGGLVSARNAGLQVAQGQYICYVDSDDWIDENLLEVVNNAAIKKHDPDMVIFGIAKKYMDHEEVILTDLPEGVYDKKLLTELVYPHMMYDSRKPFCKGLIFPAACNKIYRRSLLLKHFCEDERIRMGEDNAFVYECVWFSERIYICNKSLYNYNQLNPSSMGNSYDQNRFANNNLLTSYIDKRLSGYEKQLDEQINAFKAYWLIMAVFHEVKTKRKLKESAVHIKKEIKRTQVLKGIHLSGLPLMAKGYLVLLRCRLYMLTLLATKAVNHFRK